VPWGFSPWMKPRPPQLNALELEAPEPGPAAAAPGAVGTGHLGAVGTYVSPANIGRVRRRGRRTPGTPLSAETFVSCCSELSEGSNLSAELYMSCHSPHVWFDDAQTTIHPISPCAGEPSARERMKQDPSLLLSSARIHPPPPPPARPPPAAAPVAPRPPVGLPTGGRALVALPRGPIAVAATAAAHDPAAASTLKREDSGSAPSPTAQALQPWRLVEARLLPEALRWPANTTEALEDTVRASGDKVPPLPVWTLQPGLARGVDAQAGG